MARAARAGDPSVSLASLADVGQALRRLAGLRGVRVEPLPGAQYRIIRTRRPAWTGFLVRRTEVCTLQLGRDGAVRLTGPLAPALARILDPTTTDRVHPSPPHRPQAGPPPVPSSVPPPMPPPVPPPAPPIGSRGFRPPPTAPAPIRLVADHGPTPAVPVGPSGTTSARTVMKSPAVTKNPAGPVVSSPVVASPVVSSPVVAGPVAAGAAVASPVAASPVAGPIPAGAAEAGCEPAVHLLVLDDGRRLPLGRLMLIGRDPVAGADEPDAVLVTVDDPHRSVSKTHLAVGLDADGPWVHDRFSVNGTTVTDGTTGAEPTDQPADPAGGVIRSVDCQPGVRQAVTPGGTVFFGDRSLTIRTTARSAVANETTLRTAGNR